MMRLSMNFYFSKIEIIGLENIPKDKPCVFSPNHQNAFLDALVIGCIAPIKISYLTRSDVFNKTYAWFLDALQMIPIYRIRDGVNSLSLNEQIFEKCREKVKKDKSILMFSEGNHGNDYFLRPLKKGSSRFSLETQEMMPDKDILLIPVGLNYFHHQKPGFKISVVIGQPIRAKDYVEDFKKNNPSTINRLRDVLAEGMKDCLLLPEEDEDYLEKRKFINRQTEKYSFRELKQKIANNESLPEIKAFRPGIAKMSDAISVLNFVPLLVIRTVLKPIKDIVFKASLKYAIGMFLFPIWWLLLYLLFTSIWTPAAGWIVALSGFLTLMLREKLIKLSNPPH
jgi:1-acyl-sn-glycerol-3-phosphate acyltransferase